MAWSDEGSMRVSDADAQLRRDAPQHADGHLDDTETLFRDALRALERDSSGDADLIGRLSVLGQHLVDQGAFVQADTLLTRALQLSDRSPGEHDDEVPILLRELSRLYILQAMHARAEAPLRRLLSLTRSQGEQRPEVATILASLASVRHSLGDYVMAEDLYRQALDIRERLLTPNHSAIATTLESLAETRAARGRYADAIALFTRALAMRETTLGAGDASVRAARKRIADLQLEAAEESRVQTPPRSAPAVPPLHVDVAPTQQARAQPVYAPSQVEHSPPRAPRPETMPREGSQHASATRMPPVLLPWTSERSEVWNEIESTAGDVAKDGSTWSGTHAPSTRTRWLTALGVPLALLAVAATLNYVKSHRAERPAGNVFVEAEPLNPKAHHDAPPAPATTSAPTAAPVNTDSVAPVQSGAIVDISSSVAPGVINGVTVAPTPQAPSVASGAAANELPRLQGDAPVRPKGRRANSAADDARRRNAPSAEAAAARRVTDVAAQRAASPPPINTESANTTRQPVSPPNVPATQPAASSSATGASTSSAAPVNAATPRVAASNAATSPVLIGAAPQPQYPEALRDQQVEGDVVVQFVVDETGHPDVSSMTVVRSPHVLLTNAVRAALPQFRFEPARTAPPQSIPRPETVRYTFTFRAPRR